MALAIFPERSTTTMEPLRPGAEMSIQAMRFITRKLMTAAWSAWSNIAVPDYRWDCDLVFAHPPMPIDARIRDAENEYAR